MNPRRFLAVLALPLIALVTACGADEPAAAPVVTVTVDEQGVVIPEPTVTATTQAVYCWAAGSPEDIAWMARINAVTESYEAQLLVLQELPDQSEACDAASREVLDSRQAEEERIAAFLAAH